MNKEKVIIIGGGISGLTAGIYLLDNGFDVDIYEKHFIPGGECTGWHRSNMYIDGCAHWIVGTNPKDEVYDLWKHIGAFDNDIKIYETEYLAKFDIDGKIYTFYADLDKLREELISISKEDTKEINKFIRLIKLFRNIRIPVKKPLDMMNIFELVSFGIHFVPLLHSFKKYSKIKIIDYAKRFKSPIIREMMTRWMNYEYRMASFLYVLQETSQFNAGMVEGGSLKLVERITKKFEKLGGKLYCSKPVKSVLIENNKATGIILNDNTSIKSDFVISSTDIHHTYYDLLDNKYTPKYYISRFADENKYPLNSAFLLSYKVKKNIDHLPKMLDFKLPDIDLYSQKVYHFQMRNFSFDKTLLSDGSTLVTVLIAASGSVYDNLKKLTKEEYKKAKENIGNMFKNLIVEKTDIKENEIELLDVTTPLTYERFVNAYKGSYMAFVSTTENKGLMTKGIVKGLNNFAIASQWLMPPGGLPIALFMGKHAAIRICKMAKKKFINLEEKKKSNKEINFFKTQMVN